MKTIVLLINLLCLTSFISFAQDTLTIVYQKPHEKDTLFKSNICPDKLRSQYNALKTAYEVKAIKELIVDEVAFDTINTTYKPMLKLGSKWAKGLSTRICLCSTEPCLVWYLTIFAQAFLDKEEYNYQMPLAYDYDKLRRNLHQLIAHHTALLQENKSKDLENAQNLFYNSYQAHYNLPGSIVKTLLQQVQGITPNDLTIININNKNKLVGLVKEHHKGDLILSIHKKKAFLLDNYSGFVLKEIDLSEFEKKQ